MEQPQASIENLRAKGASSTITDLDSSGTRALTGVEMARSISDMFLTKNVTEWEDHIEGANQYFTQFGQGWEDAFEMYLRYDTKIH